MKRITTFLLIVVIGIAGCSKVDTDKTKDELSLRLQWYPQAQFAGFIFAESEGLYEDKGIAIDIRAAGPDLKPHLTVAAGTDDIGIGVPNQIMLARANGVPLTIVAQLFQDSPNRYVLLSENRIGSLSDLQGREVGLWLGGDEAEFVAMLRSVGMSLDDVKVIPQGYSILPFVEGEYELSQVTVYNELVQLERLAGQENLQILSPRRYNAAIVGDVVFTTKRFIEGNSELLTRFLAASFEGWERCEKEKNRCLDSVLENNPELDREVQRAQLEKVLSLVFTEDSQIGEMKPEYYESVQNILLASDQLQAPISLEGLVTPSLWAEAVEDLP